MQLLIFDAKKSSIFLMTEYVHISKERKEALEAELQELKTVKRAEILGRLQYAKSLGDLSENAEYHTSREEQGKNESRIQEIESMLKHVIITEKNGSDIAGLASTVIVQKDGEKEKREYTLVSPQEADMASGKMSIDSPIGQAFVGKKKGDTAEIVTPGGTTKWKLVEVK